MVAKDPRTSDEIYDAIKSSLQGKINKLTNFAETSFNFTWINAFASQQHEQDVASTATQLAGWVDYVGKELTEEDLNDLDITGATVEELNEYQEDEHLDEFAKAFGVTRDSGSKATGEVEVTTNAAITIPRDTEFGTTPDSDGDFFRFEIADSVDDATLETSGATTVTIDVVAEEVGTDYNVPANTIDYLVNPPAGVTSVDNPSPTTGGTDEESNPELRERVKVAISESAEGGTASGVEGFIEANTDATSIFIDEQFQGDAAHGSYTHVDAVVFGGDDTEVEDAIDKSRPPGVEHILIRPTQISVNIEATVSGTDVSTSLIDDDLSDYFSNLEIGEEVYRDKVIQVIMNADSDIENIDDLDIEIFEETITFNTGTDVYVLDKTLEDDVNGGEGITEVTGTLSSSNHTFVEDTDYQEWNDSAGDTSTPQDSIDWSLAGDNPDDTTDFFVTYNVANDIDITNREIAVLNNSDITVS